jgi:lysophospholipase L1-like esterase
VTRKQKVWIFRGCAIFAGLLFGFAALEIIIRLQTVDMSGIEGMHVANPAWPHLYEPNPNYSGINADGLRDREFTTEKPEGTTRIAVLGDSVAYGLFLDSLAEAFPKVLEQLRRDAGEEVEVINAAVSGYTPFNEYYFYREKIRKYRPDIVVLQICLNDIVNPQLHWNIIDEGIAVPREAVPDWEDHQRRVVPLEEKRKRGKAVHRSALLGFIESRIRKRADKNRTENVGHTVIDGKSWPIFLTVEDTVTIQDWNEQAPEWAWFREWILKIKSEVESDAAHFVLLFAPMAYQMEEGYPFRPQELIAEFCGANAIPFLDLLPEFIARRDEAPFMGTAKGFDDVWHFSPRGHEIAAESLDRFLRDLPKPAPITPPSGENH